MLKDLQKLVKEKPKLLVYGARQTARLCKTEKIRMIYLSSDCEKKTKEKFLNYQKFSKILVEEISENREEISMTCKKTFPVSVIGVLNE